MKKALLRSAMFFLLFISSGWAMAQTAEQPTGTGTSEDPYLIATLNNLYWVTQNSSSWDKHFKQTADIDANTTSGWDGGAGFLPIGNSTTPFTGTYNGQGEVISNLTINRPNTSFIGMFGMVEGGEIENLGVDADAAGSRYVGAIAGYVSFSSTVSKCQTYGTVSGDNFVGGIIGSLEDGSTLDKCGSLADVTGERYVGGLAGRNLATITDCYASGSVNGSVSDEGGLVGGNTSTPTVSNSFWDTETSTLAVSAGGTGKTTSEMKTLATFTSTASSGLTTPWDFVGTPNDDTGIEDWWNMDASETNFGGYPIPSWYAFTNTPSGDGSSGAPYQIASLNHLYWLSQLSTTSPAYVYVEQTADIAAYSTAYINSGQGFLPVGNPDYFIGSYNGQQHEIAGLFINRSTTSQVGFFSNLHDESTVFDLHFTELDILGNSQVGGLVGYAGASNITIRRSSCSGDIKAIQDRVGLLAGQLDHAGMIVEECWTEGTVTGVSEVGGLIGKCGGVLTDVIADNTAGGLIGKLLQGVYTGVQIEHCYSTGTVTGDSNIGGLFGYEAADLSQVTLTANFWDTESSGLTDGVGSLDPDPDGITGKTTTQMKTQSTFTDAGWDFVGESANGTEDIWDIDETGVTNDGYPYLSWQPTDMTWTGTSGTSWTDAANWSGSNAEPTAVKSVIIPDVSNNPVIGTAVDVAGLTIQGGGILTIAPTGSLTVNGTLANAAGNSGLIIQSTAAGTGSLIHSSKNVAATVQRDIQAADWGDWQDGWHFVSSPVADQEINIAEGWVTSGDNNDFDFYAWSEPHGLWVNFENTTDPPYFIDVNGTNGFVPGRGYMAAYQQAGTKQFKGNLNTDDISVSGMNITGAEEEKSWHLLGNPYPCALNWNGWEKSGAGGTVQIWNEGLKDYSPLPEDEAAIIPAMNGFMVEVVQDNASLTLPTAARTHSAQPWYKSTGANTLKLTAWTADKSSGKECIIRFNSQSSEGFDPEYDGHYLQGYGPVFYSLAGSEQLSVNTLPLIPGTREVPLIFEKNGLQDFILNVEGVDNFSNGVQLVDLKTGVSKNLNQNPEYIFSASEGDNTDRFLLKFSPVGISESPENERMQIYSYGKSITILNPDKLSGVMQIFNIPGQMVMQQALIGEPSMILETGLTTGVYIVKAISNECIAKKKIIIR